MAISSFIQNKGLCGGPLEYAYTMKVTEKCDIYSYGVVLLELLTGRTPVQPLDQGGDLVTWSPTGAKAALTPPLVMTALIDLENKKST
ncbi:hypothetical protein CCACVL1_10746 [Corchorus capsularis]|uniref:Serine-threonine/tyrosine-protein kinase catalytic domain-containing protein n=1 Tax=Corchorus capsularis TaxID=210143 RepID=A0A1R3IPU1_COCAP|nr:hypothetical protein CCACVL1_10746 [Corchorus capsularis]